MEVCLQRTQLKSKGCLLLYIGILILLSIFLVIMQMRVPVLFPYSTPMAHDEHSLLQLYHSDHLHVENKT